MPLTGHEGLAFGVAFSQEGDNVATIGADRTMRLWDRDTGEPVGEPVTYVDPQTEAPGDADLARGLGLGFTQVDEPLTGRVSFVQGTALSPEGDLLALGGNRTVTLRDTTSGKPIGDPLPHDVTVNDVAFGPDGDLLATADADDAVWLWDAAGEQVGGPIRRFAGPDTSNAVVEEDARAVLTSFDTHVEHHDVLATSHATG